VSLFPSTTFSNFFQRLTEAPKNPEKEPTALLRAHCGAREKTVRSAGGGDIRPSYTWRKRFLVEKQEIRRFPQDSLARRMSGRNGLFSESFAARSGLTTEEAWIRELRGDPCGMDLPGAAPDRACAARRAAELPQRPWQILKPNFQG
jgi:hypothetical protein